MGKINEYIGNDLQTLLNNVEKFICNKDLNEVDVTKFDSYHAGKTSDVILFWFEPCKESITLLRMMLAVTSALKTDNKVHLFSFSSSDIYNRAMIRFVEKFLLEYIENFRFTILDESELDDFDTFKRGKRFGQKSYFPNFNLWCVNNVDYDRLNIMHNDVMFYEKINYSKDDQIVAWVSKYVKSSHKKMKMFRQIKKKFPNVDKKYFFDKHTHTGIFSINNEVRNFFRKFLVDNKSWLIKNWNLFLYPEQEILSIIVQNGNFNLKHSNESKVWKFSSESFFIHYDEGNRNTFYIDDNVIQSVNPHNNSKRNWDPNSINILRKITLEVDSFLK